MGFAVDLGGVSRRFPSGASGEIAALTDVTLHVDGGDSLALMGPSGSGKTTFLNVVGAMDRPTEGSIFVGDFEVSALSKREEVEYRRRIGFVFQQFHLLPALTALDNVVAPAIPYRATFDKIERALELLAAVGLSDRAGALPHNLSGGEQQRVAIARALMHRPGLLLADEPTGNVDTGTGADIVELLLSLQEETNMTLLIATHDPMVATRCQRLVRLNDGRVVEDLRVDSEDAEAALGKLTRLDPRG